MVLMKMMKSGSFDAEHNDESDDINNNDDFKYFSSHSCHDRIIVQTDGIRVSTSVKLSENSS